LKFGWNRIKTSGISHTQVRFVVAGDIISSCKRSIRVKWYRIYEGSNFNSGNYLFTTDTK